MPSWDINSSSGRENCEFSIDHALAQGSKVFASIHLHRDFWKRDRTPFGRELVKDVRLELPQIMVEVGELRELLSNFEAWLDRRASFEQSIDATEGDDQFLRFSVGRSSAFIYTSEQPTFTVAARFGGYFSFESAFVVNESCVRLARDSLAELLGGIDP